FPVTPKGNDMFTEEVPLIAVEKLACPRTPLGAAPEGIALALSNRSTRLFVVSATQRRPAPSTKASEALPNRGGDDGPELPVTPRTLSAVAPLTKPAALPNRKMRKFWASTTKSLPLAGSTAQPRGARSWLSAVPAVPVTRSGCPMTLDAGCPVVGLNAC